MTRAIAQTPGAAAEGFSAMVAPAARPEFGDYQANGVMAAAKTLKTNPNKLARQVRELAMAELAGAVESLEVAGPGFINIRLDNHWLSRQLEQVRQEPLLGADQPARRTVVVDYSAPNLAKEMHVGHLRSTIIGDAISRVLEFLGHEVRRQNHVGDWGRQFGVVILGIWHMCMAEHRRQAQYVKTEMERLRPVSKDTPASYRREALTPIAQRQQTDLDSDWDGEKVFHPYVRRMVAERSVTLAQLEEAYRFVSKVEELAEGLGIVIKSPPDGALVPLSDVSRYVTSRFIQRPDDRKKNDQELEAWRYARKATLDACQSLYDRLGTKLTHDDVQGESFYAGMRVNDSKWSFQPDENQLPKVVRHLQAAGLLRESEGAQVVFPPGFTAKDGQPLPLIVQKSDEGYLYATTDLAAMRYRVSVLHADRILYVVDVRQSLHFHQVFAVARLAGFVPPAVSLEHIGFGTVMGADGRPFKTRAGGTVKLIDLLNEAVDKARLIVAQKNPDLPAERMNVIAEVVGVGAVKYADLSQNRTSDYVFSFEKMLALEGNTAPYMQYAYARIRSIFRKRDLVGGVAAAPAAMNMSTGASPIVVAEQAERALAVKLLQFAETVQVVSEECQPNLLCGYLYELAGAFTGFYESCPVLQSAEPVRSSRLALCALTAAIMQTGLSLLGIQTVEQM